MKLKAYSKATLALKVYKKQKREIKHRIHGVFALYRKIYDEIDIKLSSLTKDEIQYISNSKKIHIDNCNVQKMLTFLRKAYSIPFYNIHINKHIPLASGLGGSASDAGTIAKYILAQHNIRLNAKQIKFIALNIGSDIPFFLKSYEYAKVNEYGNVIREITNKKIRFDVVITNIPMSTKQVYSNLSHNTKYKSLVDLAKINNLYNFKKDDILNDLQPYAFKVNKSLKQKYEALLLSFEKIILSGSGGSFVRLYFNK
jgi:4-diphosphocytidyl-2-C-methyl-D-erythritol kinase